ncbi:MAG: hypothetical protein U9R56_04875, partial [candidate division Zixibacteria bacterium]|nr:hypothetical protein [candidate division Zixibacteria bacterium]
YTGESMNEGHSLYTINDYPFFNQEGTVVEDNLVVDTVKFSGTNFTVGFKLTGEKLSAGLVVRTPFDLNGMLGSSRYVVTYLNGLPTDEGSDTTFYDNRLTKYEMPLMVGVGVAYNIKDNFILSADAEYKGFGGTMIKYRDSVRIDPAGNNEEFYTDVDPEWNSVFAMRFGGEYLADTKIGTIPLRAGLGFIPIPSPNQSETKFPVTSYNFPHMIFMPLLKLFNNENTPICYTFSFGSGIQWSQIYLEWAYTYSTLGRDYQVDNSETKIRNHHLGFTFTGYF